MENTTAWLCIAAMAIVGIVAMALVLNNNNKTVSETGVMYSYDDRDRLQTISPLASIRLKPLKAD